MEQSWTDAARRAQQGLRCQRCFSCTQKQGKQACALLANWLLPAALLSLTAEQWQHLATSLPGDAEPVRQLRKRRKVLGDQCDGCHERALLTSCPTCSYDYCQDCRSDQEFCVYCANDPTLQAYRCNHCGSTYRCTMHNTDRDPTCSLCGHYSCWSRRKFQTYCHPCAAGHLRRRQGQYRSVHYLADLTMSVHMFDTNYGPWPMHRMTYMFLSATDNSRAWSAMRTINSIFNDLLPLSIAQLIKRPLECQRCNLPQPPTQLPSRTTCWICTAQATQHDHATENTQPDQPYVLNVCLYCNLPCCRRCMNYYHEAAVCRPCALKDRLNLPYSASYTTMCSTCTAAPAWTVCDEQACQHPICRGHSVWVYRLDQIPKFYKVVCEYCSLEGAGTRAITYGPVRPN